VSPGATTLVLARHGETAHTSAKRFSGGLAGDDPTLSEAGVAQVRATGAWLSASGRYDALVTSPVRRTAESAAVLAPLLGLEPAEEPGVAEMEFGRWDGLTFAEVRERYPDEMSAWLGDLGVPAGGGESFRDVERRVLAARDRLVEAHRGRTVVVVSHVTPIKILVAHAVGAPLDAVYRLELAPAAICVVARYPDDRDTLRLFNGRPGDVLPLG